MASLLEAAGAQPKNPSKGKPIHVARMETGLFTNRSPLHDPATFIVSKFYGGYIDALIDGSNMEVTNQLTLARRPGLSQWSTVTVPDPPNWFYDWRTLDCGIKVVVDTPTSTYIQSATSQTKIFTKSGGAGQGYYQGVADVLYYGDGIDSQKFVLGSDCNPANGSVSGFGIVGPGVSPGVTVTPSASAAVLWQANTIFSTMGIIIVNVGGVPTAQQLVSVNANAANPNSTQFGTSGNGSPNWASVGPGGTLTDGTITWTNRGPIGTWVALTGFNGIGGSGGTLLEPATIFDQPSNGFYENSKTGTGFATGSTKPAFTGVVGGQHFDASCNWVCYANAITNPQIFHWQQGHVYGNFLSTFGPNDVIIEPFAPPFAAGLFTAPFTSASEFLFTSGGGTSQGTPYTPVFSVTPGFSTFDGQLKWVSLGLSTWQANHGYSAWTASNSTAFSVVTDTEGNLQVCTTTGTSGATPPWHVWQASHSYSTLVSVIDSNGYIQTVTTAGTSGTVEPTTAQWNKARGGTTDESTLGSGGTTIWTNQGPAYGFVTSDGPDVKWTCVGTSVGAVWAANQIYYLPVGGFYPPSLSVPFGGAIVIDTVFGNEQAIVDTGESGSVPPGWVATPVGAITIDNLATWELIGPATTGGFAVTKGITFAYSYMSRLATDIYNTTAPPDWPAPLGPPTGSETGHISTASPIFAIPNPFPSSVVTLVIPGSTDPQVDTIVIWATLDGGSTLFFLTEVPNAVPFQTVNINESPFVGPSSVNQLIQAPINGQNNPPPVGFLPMAFHLERIWGAVGNFVFASGGPDVLTGNPNESFDPLDFFQFPSTVTRIVPTATGILIFLEDDIYAILGGPIFTTFFATMMVPGVGLAHYNALDVHGAVIYLYTSDNQLISLDPSGGAQRMGGPIADKLALFDATKVFVTVHESGNDNAVFVSDGSTGWYRLNPSQFPNGTQVWSPFGTVTAGAGAVLSIEVATGVHRLLVGGTTANRPILQRDFSIHNDNSVLYPCNFVMGNINLCSPGQIAGLTFVNLRSTRVGTSPICAFLLNEVSGSFTTFPQSQAYPWQIYGASGQPSSLFSEAFYFRDAGAPALAEHLQIKVSFPVEDFENEVLSLTLFGTIEQSPEDF
jgi:hypothetical protein